MLLPWKRPLHCYCLSTNLVIPIFFKFSYPSQKGCCFFFSPAISKNHQCLLRMATAIRLLSVCPKYQRGKKDPAGWKVRKVPEYTLSTRLPARDDMSQMRTAYQFCCRINRKKFTCQFHESSKALRLSFSFCFRPISAWQSTCRIMSGLLGPTSSYAFLYSL